MIVLDACILVAHLDARDAHHDRALALLSREATDEFAASVLSLAEALVGPAQHRRLDLAQRALAGLEITPLAPSADDPGPLARSRADTGLRMPDVCVLQAAEKARARLATFDHRLAAAARGRGVIVVED